MVRFMLSCLIVPVLTLGAGTARADSPTFVSFEVNRTFVSPSFSAACGRPVAPRASPSVATPRT